jgi:hypothetical protein
MALLPPREGFVAPENHQPQHRSSLPQLAQSTFFTGMFFRVFYESFIACMSFIAYIRQPPVRGFVICSGIRHLFGDSSSVLTSVLTRATLPEVPGIEITHWMYLNPKLVVFFRGHTTATRFKNSPKGNDLYMSGQGREENNHGQGPG